MTYIVLTKRTIWHEGDQRSRDYPGHGYPAYSEDVDQVKFFETEQALLTWARMYPNDAKEAKIFKGEKIELVTEIKLSVK